MQPHRIGVLKTDARRQLVAFGLTFIAVVIAGCGGEGDGNVAANRNRFARWFESTQGGSFGGSRWSSCVE